MKTLVNWNTIILIILYLSSMFFIIIAENVSRHNYYYTLATSFRIRQYIFLVALCGSTMWKHQTQIIAIFIWEYYTSTFTNLLHALWTYSDYKYLDYITWWMYILDVLIVYFKYWYRWLLDLTLSTPHTYFYGPYNLSRSNILLIYYLES